MKFMMVGYKCGMTRFFTSEGQSIPATIIKIYSNNIIGIRNINNDQCLIKIAAGSLQKNIKKPISGIYKKLNVEPCRYMLEFKIDKKEIDKYSVGDKFDVSFFKETEKINVTGVSKGKGFAGVIKRHNFSGQRASHGNSLSHRVPGSIGQCQTPGKVFKGKKMPGRLGNDKVTVINLKILSIYNELNAIVVSGSIPGANGNKIILKKSFS